MFAPDKLTSVATRLNKLVLALLVFCQSLLNKVSISKLTLIGFILVAMPLVMALLFGANKISQLANQSTTAIYHVAQLTQLNSKLDDAIAKVERYASQYIVLKDNELFIAFEQQQAELNHLIYETSLQQQDNTLIALLKTLQGESERIKTLMQSDNVLLLTLDNIQQEFKQLHSISAKLEKRSNFVVHQQVLSIHDTTENISHNILERLYIIPITLLIAGIFIILITKPLRRLTAKIQTLEQGNFEQEINLHGPAEIRGIVDALETMRQRLHTLELQKSSFIRHISHELKTPLAAIREGIELIYDNSVGPLNDEQKEICDIIRKSVNRLQRLIEDLLDFNIVLDSTSLYRLDKVSLPKLLDDACNVRKLDIKSKGLTIECNTNPYYFYSNAKQLSVIFDNILSNAIKYSPPNGTISVTYSCNKDHLTISIIDQGPGIATEHSDKVFDAFYQGKAPEDYQIKGSGLGLTIVKELLLRLNGSIKITTAEKVSALSQTGACVTITLPNSQAEHN
ncbi:ATP-binding protein [Colwelliaceae bacterium MEBiC 14330]